MGEWKAQISFRVAQDFRREFEAFAAKERRNTSNMGFVLLEWAFEQLKVAGSVDRLKVHLGTPKDTEIPRAGQMTRG
jgi:hypothetical protein